MTSLLICHFLLNLNEVEHSEPSVASYADYSLHFAARSQPGVLSSFVASMAGPVHTFTDTMAVDDGAAGVSWERDDKTTQRTDEDMLHIGEPGALS